MVVIYHLLIDLHGASDTPIWQPGGGSVGIEDHTEKEPMCFQ